MTVDPEIALLARATLSPSTVNSLLGPIINRIDGFSALNEANCALVLSKWYGEHIDKARLYRILEGLE